MSHFLSYCSRNRFSILHQSSG